MVKPAKTKKTTKSFAQYAAFFIDMLQKKKARKTQ